MNRQEQLLTILYDLSQTIGSEIHLQPLLKKFLQRLMYHTGYSCGLIFSDEGSTETSKRRRLEVAIGERQLQKRLGEYFELPALDNQNSSGSSPAIDLSLLPVRQSHYESLLILPVPDYGMILLLSVEAETSNGGLPFKQIFSPILANLHKNIHLCQHSEAYTASLIADRNAVRDANERFRQALDTSSDYIFLIDIDNGEIIDFNQTVIRALSYSAEEILGLHLSDLITACTPEFINDLLLRLKSKTKGEIHESNFKNNDNSQFPVEIRFSLLLQENKFATLIAVVSDITERKQAEVSLFKSKQLAETTLNAIGEAMIATDREGLVNRMNPVAQKLTGWTEKKALGQSIETILSVLNISTREPIAIPIKKVMATAETFYPSDRVVLNAPDGMEHLITYSVAPICDGEQTIHGLVLIFSDATEQIRMEETLRRTQKMNALGKLTGGIAHDYNNMLGVILGYSELLEIQLNDQPKLAKYVTEIRHAGNRGAILTEKLLAFSRKNTSNANELSINSLLQDKQHMLEKVLTARVKLVFNLADDLWQVWLDSGDLEDAIINLSINAMHAIDGNGQLTIETRNVHLNENDTRVLQLNAGDYVQLDIIDTGSGMDEATKEKMFEPFFSTKGDKGTGLGLSQVYGFVERSGGAIKVYSEAGHGTRIVFYFLRYQPDGSNDLVQEENTATDFRGNETILIVDDEPSLLSLTCEVLRQQGYHVICAKSANQVLELIDAIHVDLLVSDVIMPEMDGYQLAAIVREKYPAIKIQLVSGYADDQHFNLVDEHLHKNLINKPYKATTLLEKARNLLDET